MLLSILLIIAYYTTILCMGSVLYIQPQLLTLLKICFYLVYRSEFRVLLVLFFMELTRKLILKSECIRNTFVYCSKYKFVCFSPCVRLETPFKRVWILRFARCVTVFLYESGIPCYYVICSEFFFQQILG